MGGWSLQSVTVTVNMASLAACIHMSMHGNVMHMIRAITRIYVHTANHKLCHNIMHPYIGTQSHYYNIIHYVLGVYNIIGSVCVSM